MTARLPITMFMGRSRDVTGVLSSFAAEIKADLGGIVLTEVTVGRLLNRPGAFSSSPAENKLDLGMEEATTTLPLLDDTAACDPTS